MTEEIANGTKREIDGKPSVYYDGYWIRHYDSNEDNFANKKKLIDQLNKRVFHHAEPGINTPGFRLEEIRKIYEAEIEPSRKRVKGAMLAGALLNRGTDILTSIVELQSAGVKIESGSQLLRECGQCFMQALELGKNIKLSNGGEGLDELWGEPFKVFTMTLEQFYESRYIKISQAMSQIDKINMTLQDLIHLHPNLSTAATLMKNLAEAAKDACETIRTDPVIFNIWPRYVTAKESIESFVQNYEQTDFTDIGQLEKKVVDVVREGSTLLVNVATVRVPIPVSTLNFLDKCVNLELQTKNSLGLEPKKQANR